MLIKRQSPIDFIYRELDLDVTQEQLDRYKKGDDYIQDVFPNLSPENREFIKSGITPEQWDELFPFPDE